MTADEENGAIPVRALLASKSLTPALRARIAAADTDADGSLSVDEVLDVLRSEAALASERRVLRRVAAVLAAGLVLAIAAVGGLTYGVVAASKDTASSGGALVDKATGAPLATGAATGRQDIAALWRGADDAAMAGLTAIYATGADGVRRMWRVAGVEVAAGAWARVNTSEPGVSLYIDAAGASLEGVPAERAGSAAGAGRRLLGVDTNTLGQCIDCRLPDCDCARAEGESCFADSDCAPVPCQEASACVGNVCTWSGDYLTPGSACRVSNGGKPFYGTCISIGGSSALQCDI